MTGKDTGPNRPPTDIKKLPEVKTPKREPEVLKDNNAPVLKPKNARDAGMAPRGVPGGPGGQMSPETRRQFTEHMARQAEIDARARGKEALSKQVRTGEKSGPTILKKDFDRAK